MCVRVPIVKTPKLSEVLFADEEDEGTLAEGEDQQRSTSIEENRRRRDAEKSEIRKINVDDEIDELDQPLFPKSEILFGRQDEEPVNSRFFEIRNSTETKETVSTQVYEEESTTQIFNEDLTTQIFNEEFTTQPYFFDYDDNQVWI